MSKEWQEAMNERAIEQKLNPITGAFLGTLFVGLFLFPLFSYIPVFCNYPPHPSVSLLFFFLSPAIFGGWHDSNTNLCFFFLPGIASEGYSGKGFVQSK
jgi:hypothetical protein